MELGRLEPPTSWMRSSQAVRQNEVISRCFVRRTVAIARPDRRRFKAIHADSGTLGREGLDVTEAVHWCGRPGAVPS
jgi:hypothetical protein